MEQLLQAIASQKAPKELLPELETIQQLFPFFQAPKAIYLKHLFDAESFKYNSHLKNLAAHTTDRTVLFDYITDFQQHKTKVSESVTQLENPQVQQQSVANSPIQPGKPIAFTQTEKHSFNQWLQLSASPQPIRETAPQKAPQETPKSSGLLSKLNLIDKFIENNPKISPVKKQGNTVSQIKKEDNSVTQELMTETLAKVYLEQKKYDSAIKAFEILSLKYPEKSPFFADQIERIKILQNNKL